MTIIIGKALMNRLLCALVGLIFLLIFRNERRIKRAIKQYKYMDPTLLTIFVILPFVFPTLGWIMHLIIILFIVFDLKRK